MRDVAYTDRELVEELAARVDELEDQSRGWREVEHLRREIVEHAERLAHLEGLIESHHEVIQRVPASYDGLVGFDVERLGPT